MVFLFGTIELEILKSPYYNCDLPPHIVNIILCLHVVPGALEILARVSPITEFLIWRYVKDHLDSPKYAPG